MNKKTAVLMPLGVIILVVVMTPFAELIDNLGWFASNLSLSSSEYPYGFLSIPGMWIPIAVVVGTFLVGAFVIWSRRPQ